MKKKNRARREQSRTAGNNAKPKSKLKLEPKVRLKE
jgi:hypothetical protein